ncbi:MAG: LacI family DNA-binding transcriptional regulator [Anaerolineaceae bacterium]|nr:LacI family DNA-binding transcriptional regulator [Anaerolineaceae bacterium]MDD4042430.1 LacI family DNA-binding transcriptional regulator [Anaerolineaceae bacterium]
MFKSVTLKEVAAKAGVSYQTVSKVINNKAKVSPETEKRIWDAIAELNYTPNYSGRSLRQQRSKTIGYTWEPSPPDQANPILDAFLQNMFRAAEEKGYYLLCFPFHADDARMLKVYAQLYDTGRVDGFVISRMNYGEPTVPYLLGRRIPFVGFGRLQDDDTSFPYVDVDGGAGIAQAMEHLVALGHRKIAALAWPSDSRVGNNRLEGYYRGLSKAGILHRPSLVVRGEGTSDVGFEATNYLLGLPEEIRPTAIVCMNDMMAIGAMQAIRQAGLQVGRDIGVTGFDDTPTARYLTPPLTSISQPISEIGENLTKRLIEFLETGIFPEPRCELVAPRLEVRESTSSYLPAGK